MLLNVGLRNYINPERIVTILSLEGAPARRVMKKAKERGMCIDASKGRKVRSLIVMDSGHVVLSTNQNTVLSERLENL